MIPKEVFWSIAAVMGVSCAFGFDHWEDDADEGKYCSNCKYENREWWQEPCENCNGYNGWKGR